jgi:hypothetical protein
MTRRAVLALAVLVASCWLAVAQPPDPQSSFEPRSAPGAGQKFLAKFVGDWDVAKTFHPRSGEPVRSTGECKQTMTHGGRFLRSEFTFGQGDGQTTGTGLVGFDTQTGFFTSVWTDSRSTRMSLRQSDSKFDGEQIVLFSRALAEPGPREARRTRTVTRLEDDGRKIVHRQYAPGADGQPERIMMELILTRKDGAKPAGK